MFINFALIISHHYHDLKFFHSNTLLLFAIIFDSLQIFHLIPFFIIEINNINDLYRIFSRKYILIDTINSFYKNKIN